jgi:hypothetical protein
VALECGPDFTGHFLGDSFFAVTAGRTQISHCFTVSVPLCISKCHVVSWAVVMAEFSQYTSQYLDKQVWHFRIWVSGYRQRERINVAYWFLALQFARNFNYLLHCPPRNSIYQLSYVCEMCSHIPLRVKQLEILFVANHCCLRQTSPCLCCSARHHSLCHNAASLQSRPALESTQPPIQWIPGALCSGVKRQGRETEHSPATSVEVKKTWIYTSIPRIRLHARGA